MAGVGFIGSQGKEVKLPIACVYDYLGSIESATDVKALPDGQHSAVSIVDFLSPNPKCKDRLVIALSAVQVDERLIYVQLVFVGSPRSSGSVNLDSTLELDEKPHTGRDVDVCMNHEALKVEAVVILRPRSPVVVSVELIKGAEFSPKRQVRSSVTSEGNVFDGIPPIAPSGCIPQETPVLGAAVDQIRGPQTVPCESALRWRQLRRAAEKTGDEDEFQRQRHGAPAA
jgi:hypothetical protein